MSDTVVHLGHVAESIGQDIVDQLKTRFDPRVVFPDELSRYAVVEIERLRDKIRIMEVAQKLMFAQLELLLEVVTNQPAPKLGDWNWPSIADGIRTALASVDA